MFPASYTWDAVWTNIQSMIGLSVVLGTFIITFSLWFAPLLVRSLMGLMGVNPILKSYQTVDDRRGDLADWEEDRPRWRVEYRDADTDWRD
jgi:hypothetical protein